MVKYPAIIFLAVMIAVSSVAYATSLTFTGSGGATTFVVPAGVNSITYSVYGGGGGGGAGASGYNGGHATGTFATTPGNTLTIYVGGGGGSAGFYGGGGGGSGYYGGGGGGADSGGVSGGGGGGSSVVFDSSGNFVVAVANGGEGGGKNTGESYGAYGGDGGEVAEGGAGGSTTRSGTAGTGGSLMAGGTGGSYSGEAGGSGGSGGAGGSGAQYAGGGGGYGGGGAGYGGGAGGSNGAAGGGTYGGAGADDGSGGAYSPGPVGGAGGSVTLTWSGPLTTPTLSPGSEAIGSGQSVTFNAVWEDGVLPYTATLYSSSTSTCNSQSTLVQQVSGLTNNYTSFNAVTPSAGTYYCAYVADNSINLYSNGTISGGLSNPDGAAIAPSGSYAYVTNGGNVVIVNTRSGAVVGSVAGGYSEPYGVAIAPNGQYAYVTNEYADNVVIVNTVTNSVVGAVGGSFAYPDGVSFSPTGSYAYVVNYESSNVEIISTSSNSVVGKITGGISYPYGVAFEPNGMYAYVSNCGSACSGSGPASNVVIVAASSNSVTGATTNGLSSPTDAAFSPSGNYVYVSDLNKGVVLVNNTNLDPILSTGSSSTYAFGLAAAPSGAYLYAPNYESSVVNIFYTGTVEGSGSSEITYTQPASSGGGGPSEPPLTLSDNLQTSGDSSLPVINVTMLNSITGSELSSVGYYQEQLPATISMSGSSEAVLRFSCGFSIGNTTYSFRNDVYGIGSGVSCNSSYPIYGGTSVEPQYGAVAASQTLAHAPTTTSTTSTTSSSSTLASSSINTTSIATTTIGAVNSSSNAFVNTSVAPNETGQGPSTPGGILGAIEAFFRYLSKLI